MPKPPSLRNKVCALAREDAAAARVLAHEIEDPWYRAQAQAFVLRYASQDHQAIAEEIAASAALGRDAYQQSAARAWEIAALADVRLFKEARTALDAALETAKLASPNSSRAEALLQLLQAAFYIDEQSFKRVAALIREYCVGDDFWRCQRALKDLDALMAGERRPRQWFWDKDTPYEPVWYRTMMRSTKNA